MKDNELTQQKLYLLCLRLSYLRPGMPFMSVCLSLWYAKNLAQASGAYMASKQVHVRAHPSLLYDNNP